MSGSGEGVRRSGVGGRDGARGRVLKTGAALLLAGMGWSAALVASSASSAAGAEADGAPAIVVLVRHAEKAPEPKGDPALSAEGQERAVALRDLLAASGPTTLWASDRRRTQDTLAPLAASTGLSVEILPGADVDTLVSRLLERRDPLAVVAGHSNTVPAILRGLGVAFSEPELGDHEYDRLFVVTLSSDVAPAAKIELRYGAPSPRPAPPDSLRDEPSR